MVVVAVVGVECTPDVLCCLIKFLGPSHEMGYWPCGRFQSRVLSMKKWTPHLSHGVPFSDLGVLSRGGGGGGVRAIDDKKSSKSGANCTSSS